MELVPLIWSFCVLGASASYGPVSLDTLDPVSLSWNEVHWLVKDQIKEVEELKAEHDEIYNELTGCYGLEKCLSEFGLLETGPGSKLHSLGLGAGQISQSLQRQREQVESIQDKLTREMRERERQQLFQQSQQQSQGFVQAQSGGGGGGSQGGRFVQVQSGRGSSQGGGGGGYSSSSSSSWSRSSHSSSSSSSQQVLPQHEIRSYERRYEYNSNNRYGVFQPVDNQG